MPDPVIPPTPMLRPVRHMQLWMTWALFLCALDQLSKTWVLRTLLPEQVIRLTDHLNLVLVFNKGAAFSFLAAAGGWQTPLLIAVALLAMGLMLWMLWRTAGATHFHWALTLILSGALGNLIDRLRFGQVVDFIDVHAFGWHWPAFNVADSAISIGAVLLIIDSLRQPALAVSTTTTTTTDR